MTILLEPVAFEWDSGNRDKNLLKHGITNKEIEEAFERDEKIIVEDEKHSFVEPRYMMWSETADGKQIMVFCTIRNGYVRVISARSMNRKERSFYEKKTEKI